MNLLRTHFSRNSSSEANCPPNEVWLDPAAVSWDEAHRPPPWTGPNRGIFRHLRHREASWIARRYHLSSNKEIYDAEPYALRRALQIVDGGGGAGGALSPPTLLLP